MTPAELAGHLARECDESVDVVRDVLQALADTIRDELAAGRPAVIPGVGAFRPMSRPGKVPRRQVAWQADEALSRTVRETRPPDGTPAAGGSRRAPGERKGWRPAANLNGEPVSRGAMK